MRPLSGMPLQYRVSEKFAPGPPLKLVEICLLTIAICVLLIGVDDLFIALVHLMNHRPFPFPGTVELDRVDEQRIAILVPLWQEHRVIGRMLETNLSVLRYSNYHVFAGVYPNDPLTGRAVAEVAGHYRNLHLAPVPNNGPTSKGDCLNAAYRAMELEEMRFGGR